MLKAIFAACIFLRVRNRVLLIHHKKADLWLPPGGDLLPGEIPIDGAVRELEEETGIKADENLQWPTTYYHALIDPHAPPGFLGYEEHDFNKGGTIGRIRHCNFIFLADWFSHAPAPNVTLNDEAGDYGWASKEALEPSNDNVRRMVRLALSQGH